MKKIIGHTLLYYFRFFARLQLKKNPRAVVIGITGSSGKTSTRVALAQILRMKGTVKQSAHANSESGIPLNILGIHPWNYTPGDWLRMAVLAPLMLLFNWERYDYYIVEMGIDSPRPPKNMEYLLSIVKPDIALVLNAGIVHGAEFDALVKDRNPQRRVAKIRLEIAKEKMKLAYAVAKTGVAIINTDQKELKALMKGVRGRTMTYGTRVGSAVKITSITGRKDFTVQLLYQAKAYTLTVDTPLESAYAYTFSSAIAAAAAVGISPDKSIEVLRAFRTPRGRMRLFDGVKGSHIIDSSYNASPDTMREALMLLHRAAGKSHKIAVLGDMRELGSQSKLAHKNLADWVRKHADECLLFGPLTAEHTFPVLKSAHFPVRHFTRMRELSHYLESRIRPNSWIVVKGSQNTIFLERAVERVLAREEDVQKLARRGAYWDRIRAGTA